ncbi:unnamed protein product [Paramecium sonneborni]|uniref:Uncharacterized protein n=1 Tax=Paramecium sonneborni TaxID=65129 RepID=A0A8S1QYR9_9CILI|nr:unnamed protein product [Paramecium sonneborni]
MSKREGDLCYETFSFDKGFNKSVPTLYIVKQRIIQQVNFLKLKILHSETFFVSKNNQVMLISFFCGYDRVHATRIYWSDQNQEVGYEELIEYHQKKTGIEYIYSQEYDVSKFNFEHEFLEIQKIARQIASVPYTKTLSNCNHSTKELIKKLQPDLKMEQNFKQYASFECPIF